MVKQSSAYIYIIQCGDDTIYKIAKSNYDNYVQTLQLGTPDDLKIVYMGYFDDAINIKGLLHKKFKDYKIRTDWFSLPNNVLNECVEYVEELYEMDYVNKN